MQQEPTCFHDALLTYDISDPRSAQHFLTVFRFQQCRCLSVFIFNPDTTFHKVSQSNGVVCMSFHVQDVAMQRHRRIVQHGDGSPGLGRKTLFEKMVDGDACLFHSRSFRNAKDAAMCIEAESGVLFISMRSDGSSATSLLPACRPFVEQHDQVVLRCAFHDGLAC